MIRKSKVIVGALCAALWAPVAMAESEPGRVWTILDIGGTKAAGDAHIVFETEGGVFGSTGCNRFQGQATQSEATLKVGPLAATRMACAPAAAQQEEALFRLLSRPLGISYDVLRDQLTLTTPEDEVLLLQRSE